MRHIGPRLCSECRNGEIYDEPAVALVSHPADYHPNLKVRKWVCVEHLTMLKEDYGSDLRVILGVMG